MGSFGKGMEVWVGGWGYYSWLVGLICWDLLGRRKWLRRFVLISSRSSVNKICGASLNSGLGAFDNPVNIVLCHELGTAFVNNMTMFLHGSAMCSSH